MRTQLRRVPKAIGFGVLSGTVYGVFQVLGGDSLLSGVVTGRVFATFMAAGFYAGLGRVPHLSEVTYSQRHTVTRAVRLGRGVDDPAPQLLDVDGYLAWCRDAWPKEVPPQEVEAALAVCRAERLSTVK